VKILDRIASWLPRRWRPRNEADRVPVRTVSARIVDGSLDGWIERLWEDALSGWPELARWGRRLGLPVDFEEREDAWVLRIDVPGLGPEDLEVAASPDRVRIRGERVEGNLRGSWVERRIDLELPFPGEVDVDGVDASLRHGVLAIRAPKAEAFLRRIRRVPVAA
jgi:HSP20 family protein